MKAGHEKTMVEMKATEEKLEANQRRMDGKMNAWLEEMKVYQEAMGACLEDMRNNQEKVQTKMEAYIESMEANQGKREAVAEH
jgi:hypothetical protein